MKPPASLLSPTGLLAVASLACLATACAGARSDSAVANGDGPVNAVLGDTSFEAAFGRAPSAGDEEWTRIRTHLAFVEATLRARDVSSLSEPERIARTKNLQRLHDYWIAGVFPRNVPGTARLPRFVEPAGAFVDEPRRVCAVGAIAEHDLGSDAIDAIGARHEHDYIAAIDDAAFASWAKTSGLTLEELAMIQPSYHWTKPPIDDDGNLTPAHVQQVLASRTAAVNACVHGVLGPSDAHPKALVAVIAIAPEGNVTRATVNGTSDARIKACAERAVASTKFRRSTNGVSVHTRSFEIIAPRRDDGTLDDRYVSVVFEKASAAVDGCGIAMPGTPAGAVRLVVKSTFFAEGGQSVASVELDPFHRFSLPPDVRACVTRAVESRATPFFRGQQRQFEWHFVMKTPREPSSTRDGRT